MKFPLRSFFSQHTWLHKAYPGYLLLIALQCEAAVAPVIRRFPQFKRQWFGIMYLWGARWDWVWHAPGLIIMRQLLLKRGPTLVKRLAREQGLLVKKVFKLADRLEQKNLAKLSIKERVRLFKQLRAAVVAQGGLGYIADTSLSVGAEDWLAAMILRECPPEVVPVLTGQVFVSFQSQAQTALARIVTAPLSRQKKMAQNYIKKFHWVKNNYEVVSRPTVEEILKEVQALSKGQHQIVDPRKVRMAKQAIYKKYKVSKKLREAVQIAELL